ncbi:MAG: ABC transporter ATP-binding protein [Clostridia bacterium]
MKQTVLQVKNLVKSYNKAPVLKSISFEGYAGEILSFVGANGVGKSTTIKCISGIIPYEDGEIFINGKSMDEFPLDCKREVGYVADNQAVYEFMTGMQYLDFIAGVFKVDYERKKAIIEHLSQAYGLTKYLNRKISTYSHGTQQKIAILASLVHSPKLWILDEPFTGLDVKMTREIKQSMQEAKQLGSCVFFSSHNMDVVQRISDRAIIIINGQIAETIDIAEFNASNRSLEDYYLFLEEKFANSVEEDNA